MSTPKVTYNDLKDGIAVMDKYGIKGREVERNSQTY